MNPKSLLLFTTILLVISCHTDTIKPNDQSVESQKLIRSDKKLKRELRYLFFSNGGIVGYFDDGTFKGCPRCEFCKSNIVSMFNDKPDGSYIVKEDGSLLINGLTKEVPTYDSSDFDGWALIDYKWNIKPPQN